MTNKVVQLEDKSGNNLYPLAGGMAADSVTTAMLQDTAVTPAKIDFTIQNVTGVSPTSSVNSESSAYNVDIKRWGNIIDVRVILPMAQAVEQDATANLLTSLPVPALTLATSIPAVVGRNGATLLGVSVSGNLLFYGAHPAISATDTVRTHFTYLASS